VNGRVFLVFGRGFSLILTICCFSRALFSKKRAANAALDVSKREQRGTRIGLSPGSSRPATVREGC